MSSAAVIARDRQILFRIVPASFAGPFLLSFCLVAHLTAPFGRTQRPSRIPRFRSRSLRLSPPLSSSTAKSKTTIFPNPLWSAHWMVRRSRRRRFRPPSSPATCSTTRFRACCLTSSRTTPRSATTTCPWATTAIYQIRGFPIDLATGLEVNGMTIAGEQDVPLENKEQRRNSSRASPQSRAAWPTAGGLIDYVTKRPANIKAVDLATDHRGTAYGAVDLGHLFGSHKQVGARINLAGERIVTYMNDTNGWRAMGAGAADWKIDPGDTLKGDFEYQHKTSATAAAISYSAAQRCPTSISIYRSTMLGDQPWGSARHLRHLQHRRAPRSHFFAVVASLCRRQLQPFADSGQRDLRLRLMSTTIRQMVIATSQLPQRSQCAVYFFCPDGTYGIYDYRDPGELRIDAEAEAMLTGHIKTGAVTQDVAAGRRNLFAQRAAARLLHRRRIPTIPAALCRMARSTPTSARKTSTSPSRQLPDPGAATSLENPLESAGPRRLWEDSHQAAAIIQDRMHLPGRIQLIAGDTLRLAARPQLLAYASCADFYRYPALAHPALTEQAGLAAAIRRHLQPGQHLTLYSQLRRAAVARSAGAFLGRQRQPVSRALLHAPGRGGRKVRARPAHPAHRRVLPHARAVLLSRNLQAPTASVRWQRGDQCFESEGRETHNGVEFNAEGKAANWLRLNASASLP